MNDKLAYPVNYVGISQGYTSSHKALDLARYNTTNDVPILACYDGTITNIFEDVTWGGGLSMTIKYDNGYSSDFKHLARTNKQVGNRVKKLEEVAIMGNSGWASLGVHLHFNLYKDGTRVNPLEHVYLHKGQEVRPKDKDKILILEEMEQDEFNIGDKVIINGPLYKSSTANEPSGYATNKQTIITRKVKAKHPYNTTGDLGWMDVDSIRLIDTKETIYVVQKGDNLSSIASKYNTTWQKIYDDNKNIIGSNPNLIKPGQKLVIRN